MAPHWYRLEILPVGEWDCISCPYKPESSRSDDNAGYDLYCRSLTTVQNPAVSLGKGTLIPLGLKARLVKVMENGTECDCHYWLVSRSSIFKTPLMMANSVGVIDKTYRGELMAPVRSNSGEYSVNKGERLFQIVAPDMGWIRQVLIVDSLSETSRGEGGFGSTGE